MSYQKKLSFSLLAILFCGISACAGFNTTPTSKSQKETEAKIKTLQDQNEALTRQIETLQASLQSINEKVDYIDKRMDIIQKAQTIPKKHAARQKKKYSKTLHSKKTLHKIAHPKNKIKRKPSLPSKKTGAPPLKLYHEAFRKYDSHKFHKAADAFLKFVKVYPKHPYANNALYWTGESYYSLGNYEKAAFYFKEVIGKYPKGSKVPDALLKLGYTYAKLNKKKTARDYLFKLMDQYPFSEAAQKAQAKLDELY